MIFRPFYYDDMGCAAYVLGCGTLGKCAVVDPRADDVDVYMAFAGAKKMRITHVIDTHVHADHRSGGADLAQRTGALYCLHQSADVSMPFTPVRDGEHIELGNTRLKVLHTPGHSPDSICLLVTDLKRGADPWFVLTGDTLFVGAVGRPDLPGHSLGMWIQAAGIVVVSLSVKFSGFAVGAGVLGIGTAMVYPTLLAAIGDVAHPLWRASSVGVYRLWRDLGYAIGALLAGLSADLFGLDRAMWLVATITCASGLLAAVRMSETRRLSPA